MRNHLVALIGRAAERRPDIVFLTGDLGFSVVEPLQELLGKRFINAGVAEANMMSMAASLGACGFEPYVYSIAPFVTARCYEQIRNDICYANAPVRIVGNGAGFSYGTMGPTHHALEDATIMATLPNISVFSPATLSELDRLFELSEHVPGPIYYRIGREDGPDAGPARFDAEAPVATWRDGAHINLVTSGSLAGEMFKAADRLAASGIAPRLITLPILAPFPAAALADALADAPILVAFEGYENNPLEAGVAKLVAERLRQRVRFISAKRSFANSVGGTDHQRRYFQIDADALLAASLDLLH